MSTDLIEALGALAIVSPVPLLGDRPPLDPGWKRDDALQDILDNDVLAGNPALYQHSFAVVDLTDDPNPTNTPGFDSQTPAYAGYDDTRQRSIVSLAKLLPLYGAYYLRADLTDLTTALSIPTLAAAGTAIRQNYQRFQAASATRPNIEHMFDELTFPGPINFNRSPLSNDQLEALYGQVAIDPNFAQLPVREQLRLMVGWSEDVAATNIIRGLGFDYLWQLSVKSGLYRRQWAPLTRNDSEPGGPGGLFVGRDYHGLTWQRPVNNGAPGSPNQAGTARSVALLLTMLAQDRLVPDHAGNAAMREFLRKTNPDFTSELPKMEDGPIGAGLAEAGWTARQIPWDEDITSVPPLDPHADLAVSKIGWTPTPGSAYVCDSLLVRTTRPDASGVTITAVLVGIKNTDNDWTDLETFGKAMAPKLAARHGVA